MSKWNSPEWEAFYSGEACPICRHGRPLGIITELHVTYLTSRPASPMRGYCCLVLKRHAVELHQLSADEGAVLMKPQPLGGRQLNQSIHDGRNSQQAHPPPIALRDLRTLDRSWLDGGPIDNMRTLLFILKNRARYAIKESERNHSRTSYTNRG